jgi:hypothetical protein
VKDSLVYDWIRNKVWSWCKNWFKVLIGHKLMLEAALAIIIYTVPNEKSESAFRSSGLASKAVVQLKNFDTKKKMWRGVSRKYGVHERLIAKRTLKINTKQHIHFMPIALKIYNFDDFRCWLLPTLKLR